LFPLRAKVWASGQQLGWLLDEGSTFLQNTSVPSVPAPIMNKRWAVTKVRNNSSIPWLLCFAPILPINRFYSHCLPIWTCAALACRWCHWFPWIYINFEGSSSSSENSANVMKILHPYNFQAIHLILFAVSALSWVHAGLGAVPPVQAIIGSCVQLT